MKEITREQEFALKFVKEKYAEIPSYADGDEVVGKFRAMIEIVLTAFNDKENK